MSFLAVRFLSGCCHGPNHFCSYPTFSNTRPIHFLPCLYSHVCYSRKKCLWRRSALPVHVHFRLKICKQYLQAALPSPSHILFTTFALPCRIPRCAKKFTVTFRRHHCRSCGHVICHGCSEGTGGKRNNNQRVCAQCEEVEKLRSDLAKLRADAHNSGRQVLHVY